MATLHEIHPTQPQRRSVDAVRDALRRGAVILYPTDTSYAIGCDLAAKSAVERVRRLKQITNDKPLTFLCSSLSNIADYARVSDPAYRLLRRLVPGPYTFLLPATKQVPRLVMHPKRRTTGIRVPDHAICQALITALDNPIISTSALSIANQQADRDAVRPCSKAELFDHLESQVDILIDDGTELQYGLSTILDLTEEDSEPTVIRQGLGWEAIVEQGILPADAAVMMTPP
jgi:tRNA threonylcarbamoyl adenosine modification protein (Sua5/YciO/YrdC/YwlC family)